MRSYPLGLPRAPATLLRCSQSLFCFIPAFILWFQFSQFDREISLPPFGNTVAGLTLIAFAVRVACLNCPRDMR